MKGEEKNSGEKIARDFMVQETVLRIIGIWPTSVNSFASTGRWILAIVTHISTICSLSLEVYRHCLNIDDTMDAFVMDLSSMISLSKLFILRMNSKHTCALVESIVKDWSNVADSRHERIMTGYFKKGRIVSLVILYLGYASGLSFVVQALPLHVLLPFQMFKNSANSTINLNNTLKLNYFLATHCVFGSLPLLYHICVLLLQGMHIFFNAVSHCGNDGLFFSLSMHLCGQFEILKMNLAEIEFEAFACQEKVGFLVKRHCQLAVLVHDLEQSFSMIILVQLLMSALLICVEGFVFLVSLNTKDNGGALRSVVLMVTLLIQLYLYAYAGNTLETQTKEIAQAAYDSLWYRCRGHEARDLLLIINRGNFPYYVTAGKFVPMNLFTFKEILKASASYLSVLKVMMDI
ncbi:Odorant receptor 22c [Anthophora quadrimaculata]